MEKKYDFLGKVLKVGDEVVFMQINYRQLMRGIIVKMGKRKATIEHLTTNTCKTKSIQFHNQIIRVRR